MSDDAPGEPPGSARESVVAAAVGLERDGLNLGSTGNVSVRRREGLLITPSALLPRAMAAADVVRVDAEGRVAAGQRKPSSEWRLHLAIYAARPDVHAVVHTHSPWATGLACARRDIPAFHYMVAGSGGTAIRCAGYATVASAELVRSVITALDDRRACLLANHGVVAVGADLASAVAMAGEVELLAQQYALACLVGGPVLLDGDEMQRILGVFARYGKREDGES